MFTLNIASCVFCSTKRVLPQKTLAPFPTEKGGQLPPKSVIAGESGRA
nr:MAG TPA: hypothetical protein [Caudoviricetes sp.]